MTPATAEWEITAMALSTTLIQVERDADVLILVPRSSLSELTYEQFASAVDELFSSEPLPQPLNIVLDFAETEYFGSDVLSVLLRIWKRVCAARGRMALCNISLHEQEILRLTRLDTLWQVCSSRNEAVDFVRG
jgi:anti-anti-sigma factor